MIRIKKMNIDAFAMLVVPLILLFGIGGLVPELLGSGIIRPLLFLSGCIAVIATQFICSTDGKKKTVAAYVMIGATVLYIAITFVLFKAGLAAVLNDLIESLKQIRPYGYVKFYVGVSSVKAAKNVFLVWAAAVAGSALVWAVRKAKNLPLVIVTIIWLIVLMTFHSIISPLRIVLSAMALAVWIFHNMAYRGMTDYNAILSGDASIVTRVVIISVVTVMIFNIAAPEENYKKQGLLSDIESFFSDAADNMRYGGTETGLYDGKMYEAGNLERSDETMLEVKMTSPESYYLRGFVGGTYENSRWFPLGSENLYKSADMFYWLHKDGFYGFSQLSEVAAIEDEVLEPGEMSVKNINASRKYVYMPYELVDSELMDSKAVGDERVKTGKLTGEREYTFSLTKNQVKRYQSLSAALIESEAEGKTQNYITDESYYNDFVYDNYTSMPPEIASLLSEYLGEYVVPDGETHFDYQMAKQNIMFFMTDKMEYSEEQDKTGKDIDFILNFLEGSKKGYDIHFASAAAMMFRYYGIPARYVEGYIITKNDVNGLAPDSTLALDGTHAHAWVEYYHDGIGWLPFEVTPAYLDTMESPDVLQDISALLGQDQGEDKELEEEEEKEPQTEDGIQSFLIKYKMLIILTILGLIVAGLVVLFIMWLARERKKVAARIASFDDEDVSKGICNIFSYTIDLLTAWGLQPSSGYLKEQTPEICRLIEEDISNEYADVVEIRQEAKYSHHKMTEDDRMTVKSFMYKIREKMWRDSGFIQRLKYKYMYFL